MDPITSSRRGFLAGVAGVAGLAGAGAGAGADAGADAAGRQGEQAGTEDAETVFRMVPVGKVEKGEDSARIRIFEPFVGGLLGLDGWSHVNVLYWFDRNDVPQRRGILRVHPRGDARNPLTGVFACRAPVRPNLIALSVCRILSVEGGVVTVDAIDAFDGTPVVDLKPLVPPDVRAEDLRVPEWTGRER